VIDLCKTKILIGEAPKNLQSCLRGGSMLVDIF
jgi:hypothetical protein